MRPYQQQAGRINVWLVLLLAFCLPLSTTAVTLLAVASLACWCYEGEFARKWEEIRANPICIAVFCYLGVFLIGLCWSDDLAGGVAAVKKQWKIWLLPVLLTTVHWQRRWWYLAAYIAGVSSLLLLVALVTAGVVVYPEMDARGHLSLIGNQIVFTPMLAWAVYLLLHQLLWAGLGRWQQGAMLLLAGAMTWGVFMTKGRAGQLVFFVLMVVLIVQYFRRNLFRAALVATVLLPLIFASAYQLSPVFQDRTAQIRQNISAFDQNPNTSVGQRLFFWKNSWEIIRQSPWLGVGTGGFAVAYAQVNQQRSPALPATVNPHSQYILAATEQGVLGVLALLGLFAAHFWQARRLEDAWQRIRWAFPLFFLTIMATDSYLNTFGSGFLFSLFSAVLFKSPATRAADASAGRPATRARHWLILSYRANIPGAACSQHIDDRLPLLQEAGITPILLSGPVGGRLDSCRHHQTWSLAPSGIRFELRHFLRRHLRRRWQFKLAETLLLVPVLPLYALEKIWINLESEWSWFVSATVRGFFLERRYRPEVIYSTGGSASAHLAALVLNKYTSAQWIAEIQDPLVHDHDWSRSQKVFDLYCWLEKRIAQGSDAFVFLTRQALMHAQNRVGSPFAGVVIYPGATPARIRQPYSKGALCRFAHFGSLAGTRNLLVFLQALHQLLQTHPEEGQRVRLDIYGSLDSASKILLTKLHLEPMVTYHGLVDRQAALRAMEAADCLLLIQNISFFSTETIPSKVYEYFLCSRPILGLIHQNQELTAMLRAQSHFVAKADDPLEVKEVLGQILALHATTPFVWERALPPIYTTDQAVRQLLALADRPGQQDSRGGPSVLQAGVGSGDV